MKNVNFARATSFVALAYLAAVHLEANSAQSAANGRARVLVESIVAEVPARSTGDFVDWVRFSVQETPTSEIVESGVLDLIEPGKSANARLDAKPAETIGRVAFQYADYQELLAALRSDPSYNILSTPSLIVAENQPAQVSTSSTLAYGVNPFNGGQTDSPTMSMKVQVSVPDRHGVIVGVEAIVAPSKTSPAETSGAATARFLIEDGGTAVLRLVRTEPRGTDNTDVLLFVRPKVMRDD